METKLLAKSVVQQIVVLINAGINPGTSNEGRIEANTKLNDIINTEIHTNTELYLEVALMLVGIIDDANGGPIANTYLMEIYINYGFKIINALVKYNWYNFDQSIKDRLKQDCVEWCNQRLFLRLKNNNFPCKVSTSSLVLNACSQAIVEIFIREWPNNWHNFISECTKYCSLVTVYSFLNISDYLHTLLIPTNANRRKEIIKSLLQEKESVYLYFQKCLAITESDNFHDLRTLTLEYKQTVVLKALQTLESLFEWFYLDQQMINRILLLASNSQLNLDSHFAYKAKLFAYRCIQSILKQTNSNRGDDAAIISDIFHDCSPDKFTSYLVTNVLNNYLTFKRPIEANHDLFELFVLVMDISVEIICQVISQFNKDTTKSTLRSTISQNQTLWASFLSFVLDCLQHNNANFDEIILKFLLPYSKLQRAESVPLNEQRTKMISPIVPSVDENIPLQFLTLIGHCKIDPKTEVAANNCELRVCYNIDSYQSYLNLFHQNRSKFLQLVHEYAQNHQPMCQIYLSNVFRELLGPLSQTTETWPTGIPSWNVVATLCAAIIPKLDYSEEFKILLETYFDRLLQALKEKDKDEQVLSQILSTLSSMSTFYKHFSPHLIKQLIECIFEFTLKNNDQIYSRNTELQNHAGALFIRLTINCSSLLLPFFELMRTYIDNLIDKQLISSIQFCFLYEGLIILSNHFEDIEVQRNFILHHLLTKIGWITTYDFGVNGSNFFADLGLSKEPNFGAVELPIFSHPRFGQTFVALNLLARLFKRINPSRCLAIAWFTILEYISPFYKVIAAMNTLWHFYQAGDRSSLDSLCHPFYQQCLFTDTPLFYLNLICADRPFLVPKDPLKDLMSSWDRQSPPSRELIALHTQQRICVLYSQTIAMLSSSLNFLFFYHSTYPSSETVVETFLHNSFQLMFSHCKSLPLIYYFDLIKLYLRTVAAYCPRTEKLLKSSQIVQILNDFLPFMFNLLDHKFQTIKNEKECSIANSEPTKPATANKTLQSRKSKDEQNFEICTDFVLNVIGQEYVLLLRDIFNDAKNITGWASKYHLDSQQQQLKTEDDCMEDELTTVTSTTQSKKETTAFVEDALLSKHLISLNASPLVIIVSNCLLWPLDYLRCTICEVNTVLVQSLTARNLIDSVDGFYYLAERIIRALNLTEKSDAATVNSLLTLFAFLYEQTVFKHDLKDTVNPKLAQICAVNTKQWDQFWQCFAHTGQNEKKKQHKLLKSLLDNVYSKDTSSLHSLAKPDVVCLGLSAPNNSTQRVNDFDSDADTFSLSWLL